MECPQAVHFQVTKQLLQNNWKYKANNWESLKWGYVCGVMFALLDAHDIDAGYKVADIKFCI